MHLKKSIPLSAFRQSLIKSSKAHQLVIIRRSQCKICLAILGYQEVKSTADAESNKKAVKI